MPYGSNNMDKILVQPDMGSQQIFDSHKEKVRGNKIRINEQITDSSLPYCPLVAKYEY